MSHGAFLISALCVLLHFLPRALGDTTLTEVCVEGDCASPKRSRSLIQKGKTSFQRGHNTNDLGKSGVRDEDALRLGEEEGQKRQDNQGLKDPDDEHPREGPKEKEKEDDFAGESLLQPRKATKDGNENQVYIGPNHYQAHETVCTEEPLGLYCDKDSGNPENRVNDRDTSHWSYPKERFRIYRSTAICVKKGHGEGWGHDIKITCQARKMGNWDQKAYWDKIHHNVHRYTGNYDPTEWETKELFVGANKEDKASMCIEEREGWTCNNEDNKDLTDQGFTIYRRNPICAWMDTTQYANRWTQKLKIECSAGIKGCGSTKLKKKKETWPLLKIWGKGCVRKGDCVSTKNYPNKYGSHDECNIEFREDVSVCRLGYYWVEPGGPFFTYRPHNGPWFGPEYHWQMIESPAAMPPVIKKYDQLDWLVRGSTPRAGWQFCFTKK